MENLNQDNQTTLLDLNMDVLDKIFKGLNRVIDKINLAKVHPRLAEAFAVHGRMLFRKMNIQPYRRVHTDKENFLIILKNCGDYVQCIEIVEPIESDQMQLIVDYCPNVQKLIVGILQFISKDVNELASLPLTTLELSTFDKDFDRHILIRLLRNCSTLRKLQLFYADRFEANFIRTILNILDENGVTPDDPFELVMNKEKTKLDEKLLQEISLCDKSHLLIMKYVKLNIFDYDVDVYADDYYNDSDE